MVVVNSFSKEMAIRKRIATIFNKREEEEVEDMTFNLIEGIDVPAIEGKIAQYHKESAEQIMNAQQFKNIYIYIMNAQARKAEEYAAALATSKGHPDSDPGYKSMKEGFGITCRHPQLDASYAFLMDEKARKLFDDLIHLKREKALYQPQRGSKRRKMMSEF
ncbi:hypothetical protein RHSIM_Rhsim01G0060600 [Rhododendron simsii]|uniref:MAT1 centre domain-containing protein n=1 Tax=Rhododendron simsii TaxID=118357 RepID=A0A834HUX1_RHOSS|nr:hypothetical protein RHSIM_Rhsim01G0060600 [Rhododendron simsii]